MIAEVLYGTWRGVAGAVAICMLLAWDARGEDTSLARFQPFLKDLHDALLKVNAHERTAASRQFMELVGELQDTPEDGAFTHLTEKYPDARWFLDTFQIYLNDISLDYPSVESLRQAKAPLSFYFTRKESDSDLGEAWQRADFSWPSMRRGAVTIRVAYICAIAELAARQAINYEDFKFLSVRAMQSAGELRKDELSDELAVADYIALTKAVNNLIVAGEKLKKTQGGDQYAVLVEIVGGVFASSVQSIGTRRGDLVEGFNRLNQQ